VRRRTQADERFVVGVPELRVEVAHTSRYNGLGPNFDDCEHVGVLAYVVRAIDHDEVHRVVLRDGHFVALRPGPDKISRSEVFPELWLDPNALLSCDFQRRQAAVSLGCATPEHAGFVARLAAARKK
jgi:hypothetical protein